MAHNPPTQQDVATLAKVHRTTVSLALRNFPGLPEATRERVKRIAKKIGYIPDPMLSALIAYRNRNRTKSFRGTLAWVVNNVPPFDWRNGGMFVEYYENAKRQALLHGYNLEIFDLAAKGTSVQRTVGILRARGIVGLLLCPQPRYGTELDFPWEDFTPITFGFTLARPALHAVAAAHFRAMNTTLQKVRDQGCTRIGFVFSRINCERSMHQHLAAYLADEHLLGVSTAIPPLDIDRGDFARWYREHRPDAVISSGIENGELLRLVARAGLRVPRDLALACPVVGDKAGILSGMYENSAQMGILAVDLVVSMIHQGIRGIPASAHCSNVDAIWVPGKTLSARPTKSRKPTSVPAAVVAV